VIPARGIGGPPVETHHSSPGALPEQIPFGPVPILPPLDNPALKRRSGDMIHFAICDDLKHGR
jgi:hypothetical protein